MSVWLVSIVSAPGGVKTEGGVRTESEQRADARAPGIDYYHVPLYNRAGIEGL